MLSSLAVLPAFAASWQRIADGANGLITYYAGASVRADGKLRRVELLYDYKELQENPDGNHDHETDFRSTTTIAYVDCQSRRIAVEGVRNFEMNMGKGKVVGRSPMAPSRKFQEISAGAEDDAVFRWVCARATR